MRRFIFPMMWWGGFSLLLAGCSSKPEVGIESTPAEEKEPAEEPDVADRGNQAMESCVVRAVHFQAKGSCIEDGDTRIRPLLDAFTVVEVVEGEFKAKHIVVRYSTEGGSAYPKELAVGKVYTLRLRPSERMKRHLQLIGKDESPVVYVDGDEIEERKPGK